MPIYTGKCNSFDRKMAIFFLKNLTVLTGTLDDLDFPVKTVKFLCKNRPDFLKKILKSQEKFLTFSGKFYNFFKKICQFIQENLTVFIGKCDDFCRKI